MSVTNRKISAVLPCLNEEETIGLCIDKIKKAFERLGVDGQIVVGDNGSTDRSVDIAESMGAKVVHQSIRGYGAALMAGIDAADGDFIIMGDADDSYDWLGIAPYIEKLEDGYDLVMGNRFKGGIRPGAMPFLHRYFGNPALSGLAKLLYKIPVGDFQCGLRAFTKQAYSKMQVKTEGMEFATEMVINSALSGLKMTEIPITLSPDKRSRAPHLRTFSDGWRYLRFIMSYAPDYLYMIPGVALFMMGLVLQVMLVNGPVRPFGYYMGIHYLALGCLLSLVGFNVLNLGVFAKTVVVRHHPHLKSRLVDLALNHFTLEIGLIIGTMLLILGGAIDMALLWRWLAIGGPMPESIHIVFVATTSIAVGVNVIFSSFLLNMFITEEWRDNDSSPHYS